MKVEIHHKADEGEGFVHVANVEVPDNIIEHWRVLEYAYRWTNNIGGSWSIKDRSLPNQVANGDFNERVEVVAPLKLASNGKPWGHRSSMLGDIFIAEGKRYRVATFGFEEEPRRWRITGTLRGQSVTVTLDAVDRDEAVRKGSHAPHMLVVRDCVLVEPLEPVNAARAALTNAVNRAIAEGAPVYVNQPPKKGN